MVRETRTGEPRRYLPGLDIFKFGYLVAAQRYCSITRSKILDKTITITISPKRAYCNRKRYFLLLLPTGPSSLVVSLFPLTITKLVGRGFEPRDFTKLVPFLARPSDPSAALASIENR